MHAHTLKYACNTGNLQFLSAQLGLQALIRSRGYMLYLRQSRRYIFNTLFHFVYRICKCRKAMLRSKWEVREAGRSPAHTKAAHSNTNAGQLLKINPDWKQASDKKSRRPSSLPTVGTIDACMTPPLYAIFTSQSLLTSGWRTVGFYATHCSTTYLNRTEQMTKASVPQKHVYYLHWLSISI